MIYRVTFQVVVDVQAKDEETAEELAKQFVQSDSNGFEDGVDYLECKVKPVKLNIINQGLQSDSEGN